MRTILFCLMIFCSILPAQKNQFTGNLSQDSKIVFHQTFNTTVQDNGNKNVSKKSPFIAAALSFVIPGAGEFYTESYLKSAAFIAVETAAIVIGLSYDKKGDEHTVFFENFADQHWSASRYAKWTVTNAKSINSNVDASKYNVFLTNGNVNWDELNRLESDLGSYYSHRLPKYGEQQYFELIGKYPQFVMGWDDFGDENTPFEYDVERKNLTARFYYYSVERGKANDYYNVASKAVIVVMVNHIISAVDAALTAASFNKKIEAGAELKKINLGFRTEYIPHLNLRYNF